jgi:hypothetical protein
MTGAAPSRRVLCEARIAVIFRLFPTDTAIGDVEAAVNAIPGPPATRWAIYAHAYPAGLKRGTGTRSPLTTPERAAILREGFADGELEALLAAMNALPGRTIGGVRQVYDMGRTLGLRRSPAAIERAIGRANAARTGRQPAAPAASGPLQVLAPLRVDPAAGPEAADAAVDRRHARALALLGRARDLADAASGIAADTGLPLREVFRLAGELREARRERRAAA